MPMLHERHNEEHNYTVNPFDQRAYTHSYSHPTCYLSPHSINVTGVCVCVCVCMHITHALTHTPFATLVPTVLVSYEHHLGVYECECMCM